MHEGNKEIILVIVVGTLAILLLAASLIAYVYFFLKRQNRHLREKEDLQRQFDMVLRESQIEVQESTMSLLGKELHDNIGQLLSSTKMLLGLTQRGLPEIPETLNTASETLGQAISEIRSLSKVLSKEWLEQFDLIKNLENEVQRINAGKHTIINLSNEKKIELEPDRQIVLFRIIQEALQNAIKHAQPEQINIYMTGFDNRLLVKIVDDGKGFTETGDPTGMGLMNMKQRTRLLGGTIEWKSAEGKGCKVEIDIPGKTIA